MKLRVCFVVVSILSALISAALAQTAVTNSSSASTRVPRLIKFSGIAKDESGKPMQGTVGITFLLYKDQQGGTPLWLETQNVEADATGHYTALLGSASAEGVPVSLFSSAEVHWISTQISGQPEQPRVALLSVPYALKAADAETLGGLPASAFMHAAPNSAKSAAGAKTSSSAPTAPPPAGVTGKGTKHFIPIWTGATALGNSTIFETGGNVGIGTKTPKAAVDVVGSGVGVIGASSATSGTSFGVRGSAASTSTGAAGVTGFESAASGEVWGVSGQTNSTTDGAGGVFGFEGASTGQVHGVSGQTNSASDGATGVDGYEGATTGAVYGVNGGTASTTNNAAGVNGYEYATTGAVFGVSGGTGSSTDGASGISGFESATSGLVYGVDGGTNSSTGAGVLGDAFATSGFNVGVYGRTVSPGGSAGVFTNLGGAPGWVLLGNGSNYANVFSVDASGNGFYAGNLNVTGKLTKGSGSFKIDHPLDPANKYLSHSFVESPDMMNVYNGNITTDRHGLATVLLPDYFEALNGDFRYQLTVIGQFAQAIVAKKIASNHFVIRTNKPGVEVSWQVTGIRHDAYANAYRIPTEEDKPAAEQGYYLHPEVFGQPASKGIQAASQKAAATGQLARLSKP
jgi:hypothetical protein